ncbi:MAG: ABC transporter ATP-binding protein [Cyanobacteria bacterium J06621_12]
MSNPVIEVENLGKKYTIRHQDTAGYSTFRDALVSGTKYIVNALTNPQSARKENTEEFWALKDFNLTINQGDRLGIIGRNGAGKSTLLKILSRITEPTTGKIKLKGRVASLLEVGTGFHPELSGRENIFLNGAILGMSKIEIKQKFDEIVAFSEIEKFLDTPVKRYSSGMYVRLAFAVAAHLEPEILIIDEVLAVGDSAFQQKCLGKMQEVGQDGRTVIFVSHNMATVKQLCNKACLLANGTLIDQGEPGKMIVNYMENTVTSKTEDGQRNYQHIKGDRRAEITNITLNNIDRGEVIVPVFGKIKVAMEYQINEPIERLEFFVLIHSLSTGEVLSSIWQKDTESFITSESKQGTICVEFINQITPGKYIISAGIYSRGKCIDWVEYAESFIVEPVFNNGKKYDRRPGKTSFQGDWYS